MRNLFLLFFCVVMVILLKEAPQKKEKLERLDVKHSQVLDFSGTFFLPLTLQADVELVNNKTIELSVAGKKYLYRRCYNRFCLRGEESREVPVSAGDKIKTSFPVKLFFAKEVE